MESAFGLLKGRWRLLLKKIEQRHDSVARRVTAARIFHNFCIMQGDVFDDDESRQPPNDDDDGAAQDGSSARQAMLDYLAAQGVL